MPEKFPIYNEISCVLSKKKVEEITNGIVGEFHNAFSNGIAEINEWEIAGRNYKSNCWIKFQRITGVNFHYDF